MLAQPRHTPSTGVRRPLLHQCPDYLVMTDLSVSTLHLAADGSIRVRKFRSLQLIERCIAHRHLYKASAQCQKHQNVYFYSRTGAQQRPMVPNRQAAGVSVMLSLAASAKLLGMRWQRPALNHAISLINALSGERGGEGEGQGWRKAARDSGAGGGGGAHLHARVPAHFPRTHHIHSRPRWA